MTTKRSGGQSQALAQSDPLKASLIGAVVVFASLCAFVAALSNSGLIDPLKNENAWMVTFYLMRAQDVSVAIFLGGLFVFLRSYSRATDVFQNSKLEGSSQVWLLALVAFFAAWILTVFAHHNFDMSLDEFSSAFQAQIFLRGQIAADIPEPSVAVAKLMQPVLIYVDGDRGIWMSNYRPGFAAMRAAFESIGAKELLNPTLAVIAVLATAKVARQLWPDHKEVPVLAALLLVSSPQFLISASANFAYTAYLALQMVWLALFLHGRTWAHWTAAVVGAVSIGLHQIHVHVFFATPFLFAMLLGALGSRRHLLPYILIYGLAGPFFILWVEIATWLHTGDWSAFPSRWQDIRYLNDFLGNRDVMRPMESQVDWQLTLGNVLRFAVWISPALLLLLLAPLFLRQRPSLIPALCLTSFIIFVLAHHVLMPNQMQSWGSRYYNPVLGALVVFALSVYVECKKRGISARQLRGTIVGLSLVGLVVLVPWRGIQIEEKVGPRAAFQEYLAGLDADTILYERAGLWFPIDVVRNDPFMENLPRMIVLHSTYTEPSDLVGQKVISIDFADANRFGLGVGTLLEPGKGSLPDH